MADYVPWSEPNTVLKDPFNQTILGVVLLSVSVRAFPQEVEVVVAAPPDMVRFTLPLSHGLIREFFELLWSQTECPKAWPPPVDNHANFVALPGRPYPTILMRDPLILEGEIWGFDPMNTGGKLLSMRDANLTRST